MSRNLQLEPAWNDDDLGMPLPMTEHACSVCLPTWDSIVGYEEGKAAVVERMKAGYPRFFIHPRVKALCAQATRDFALEDEAVIVFPTKLAAQNAQRWLEKKFQVAARISSMSGLEALIVPKKHEADAYLYWRFSGEIVTSRQAKDALRGDLAQQSKSGEISRELKKWLRSDEIFVFSTGMSAETAALRAVQKLRPGKKTLQLEFPYVDCLKIQDSFGNGVVYLNRAEGAPLEEALNRIAAGEFAAVMTEIPSNPLLRTIDVARISAACALGETPLVIDDSVSGAYNVDVLGFADIVTGSLTKWHSGKGDVMGGFVALRTDGVWTAEMREFLTIQSEKAAPLYPRDAEVLLANMAGFEARMKIVNENGIALAKFLADHPAVEQVMHPSLVNRDRYEVVKTERGGYGGLLSFVLKSEKKASKVYDALRISKGPSFGTEFSLVCPFTLLAHYDELEWAEGCGVSRYLLRVSVGLEAWDDLQSRFAEALA